MKKRFSDEQIVAILREGDSGQVSIAEICRNHGISESTFYGWKQKFGTINEPEVWRLREPMAYFRQVQMEIFC